MAPKNVILTLLALCGVAFGQTRSLLVDTSGIVQYTNTVQWQGALSFGTNATAQAVTRSNLSLGLPALTNTTGAGLLSAIGGLATNGDASALTNFPPAVLLTNSTNESFPLFLLRTNGSAADLTNFPPAILQTNSPESDFPQALLRTNGDGSGLTNLPNADLGSATGILPIVSGGTGQTNAEAAIEALLPAYTNNADKILALNSNATGLVWTTNAGGGTTYTNAEDAMLGLFFASTNDSRISLFANGGTNANNQHTVIGSGASAFGTNILNQAVVIGASASVTNGGVAIGSDAATANGVAVGPNASATGSSVAFGRYADARGGTATNNTNVGSVALGTFATAFEFEGVAIGSGAQAEDRGIAIGASTLTDGGNTNGIGGVAIGYDALATAEGVAIGDNAVVWEGVSIGSQASSASNSIAIGKDTYVDPFLAQAIQIGTGTNTNDNTIQFWSAGGVTTNGWSALANSTDIGQEIMQAPTNGANGQVLLWTNNDVVWSAVSNTVTDASTLTNFPTLNQNTTGTASNVTGVVAIANGGSGQTTAAAAIEAFLPSYSGNANRILALNSNATSLLWTTNSGGGLPETPLAISNGGTAATTAAAALTNLTLLRSNSVTVLGQGATGSNGGAAIGNSANASGADSIAILGNATNAGSIAIGNSSSSTGQYGISIGYSAVSGSGGRNIAIGLQASVATGSTNNIAIGYDANTSQSNSIAVGFLARALTNNAVAIGAAADADAVDSVGVGTQADISATATNSVQLGRGTNSTANSIQFRSAGTVDTTEWGYLANASTAGGSRMTNTNGVTATNTIIGYDGTNYTTNTITVIDGIITSWTQ